MRRYWVVAALLHVGLIGALLIRFDWWQTEPPGAPPAIQATLVNESELKPPARVEKKRDEERQRPELERKRQQEAERKRQERLKAEEAKRRQEEQARREEAERQKRIALEKEKRRKAEEEKRRKLEEEKRKKAEAEKRRKAEEARRRKAEEEKRKKAEAERKRREAERRRREEALKSQLAEEEAFLEGESRRKNQALIARYMGKIQAKVENRWLEPPTAKPGMSSTVRIRLAPSGEVLVVVTVRSSGDSVFDRSVEAAVRKASPLPLPPDPNMLPGFPELNFNFKK